MKSHGFAALCVAGLVPLGQLHGEEEVVSVRLDPETAICRKFMGFGAEWDSNSYDDSGVTEADFAIIRKRVEWMRLPVARIMMQSKWCYKGNGQYDWNDPKMNALCRQLDVCQKLGTTVLLTDWGIEQAWLATPEVGKTEDPKYAGIISTYMDLTNASATADQDGFPAAVERLQCNLDMGVDLVCEANCVVFLSSIGEDPHNKPDAAGGK